MAHEPDTLAYGQPADPRGEPFPPPQAHRTLKTWLALWLVWFVGLGVWAVYIVLIVVLLVRVFL